MPGGLKRFQNAGSLHFITFRCFHRFPLLESPGACETFETVLEQTRARHQARAGGPVNTEQGLWPVHPSFIAMSGSREYHEPPPSPFKNRVP